MCMNKIIYYPLWKIEKLEKRLRIMELCGWRLSCVKYNVFFVFEKGKPRDAEYIVTYNIARDWHPNMYEYEHQLLSKHSANRISSRFTTINLFRITGTNRNFDELVRFRKKYIKRALFQKMIIASWFFILALVILLVSVLQEHSVLTMVTAGIFASLTLIIFTYRVSGYIMQKRNC